MLFAVLGILLAIAESTTRNWRQRIQIQSELVEMGAIYVSFDESNSPDWISFSVTNISEEFAALKHVKDIWLDNAQLTDSGIEHLAGIDSIGCLHMTECNVTDRQIEILSKINSIKILRLNDSTVSDKSIDYIVAMRNLTSVDISGTMISEDGSSYLKRQRPDLTVRHEN